MEAPAFGKVGAFILVCIIVETFEYKCYNHRKERGRYMKKRLAVLLTGLSLLLTACGGSSDSSYMTTSAVNNFSYEEAKEDSYETADVEEEADTNIQTVDGKQYEKKLVYTCDLSIETLEYDETFASIKEAINKVSGFIQSESSYTRNYGAEETRYCSLTVRVPSNKYDAFLSEISQAGSVTNRNAYVENITQQYYDTETRVKALKIQEERLLAMLAECDNVSDMIVVEERLTEVQSEMARYQTSLNLMQTEVDYSTVNISIDEVARITVHEDTLWDRFINVVSNSWEFFTNVLSVIGIAIVYMFPFAVVAGLILWVIHVIRKKKKAKKDKNQEVQTEKK